jgi:hypothetical protein
MIDYVREKFLRESLILIFTDFEAWEAAVR